MNEAEARQVLLVRAVEESDGERKLLGADDRNFAGRTAADLVRWQAADRGAPATPEAFVAKRAELLAAKLAERWPKAAGELGALRWRPWIGIAVPLGAFALGLAAENIADRQHLNILAFPLLGLIVWNLAVYAWLLAGALGALAGRSRRSPSAARRWLADARLSRRSGAGPLAGALAGFALDWAGRSVPLVAARAGRILHLSAALLALGAIAGMYVRGLAFEYRAGWESTFLDADAVHGLLMLFLAPAASLAGLAFPGVDEIAAIRWGAGGTGENAARWIHLYTATVLPVVVLPRLALAACARWRERAWSARFPLSLDEPYFRRVLTAWRDAPAQVRVVPYAYTLAEPASEGMQRLAERLFGDDVRIRFEAPVAFGEEDAMPDPGQAARRVDLVIALCNLASTPEIEHHGVFLDALNARASGAVALLVDESPYRKRLGAQAGADRRLGERRQAWLGLAGTRGLRPVFVALDEADLSGAQGELERLLDAAATRD